MTKSALTGMVSGTFASDETLQLDVSLKSGFARAAESGPAALSAPSTHGHRKPAESTARPAEEQLYPRDQASLREINRHIVRKNLADKYDQFAEEHQILVLKKLTPEEQFTKRDQARLGYLRWQIDAIDDAIAGESFDRLEALVQSHETVATEIRQLVDVIESAEQRGRRRLRKGRR